MGDSRSDQAVADTARSSAESGQRSLQERLERRVLELSILHELGQALQSTMALDQVLGTILVGATAHQGLSLNRAFLLLVEPENRQLVGRAAVGPSDAEDAARIWSRLIRDGATLAELLRDLEPLMRREDRRVNEIVRNLGAPVDGDGFLAEALRSDDTVRVEHGRDARTGEPVEPDLLARLGTDSLVAVPLVAEQQRVGLLLADNAITGRAIEGPEVQLLEMLGVQAAIAIHRARLLEDLENHAGALDSAHREIQENQRRLLEAERLSALGQMAARVAHEIRNPLVVIGGFARTLRDKIDEEDDAREAVGIILDEVRRLERIVEPVLDFTKDPVPRIGRIDPSRLGEEAFALLQWELDKLGVIGRLDVEDGCPAALGDRDQVFQALINLMHNGLQAMPRGGSLTVRACHTDGIVEIAVTDSGDGIASDVLDRIHEPFFTTKSRGTGLGLAIVHQILRNHRGDIDIDTEVGRGTTVTMRLPVAKEE